MFRHVVMFRWLPETSAEDRDGSVRALRAFAEAVADLGVVTVGTDAGLGEDNYDVVVIAEFTDPERYRRYAADARHVALVDHFIKPHAQARAAVQADF